MCTSERRVGGQYDVGTHKGSKMGTTNHRGGPRNSKNCPKIHFLYRVPAFLRFQKPLPIAQHAQDRPGGPIPLSADNFNFRVFGGRCSVYHASCSHIAGEGVTWDLDLLRDFHQAHSVTERPPPRPGRGIVDPVLVPVDRVDISHDEESCGIYLCSYFCPSPEPE